jgi:hypothetical protein
MLNRQRMNAVEYEIGLIDEQILELAAEGYMIDVDSKLEERREQQLRRGRLERAEVPNG